MIGIIFSTNADLKKVLGDLKIEREEQVRSFCFLKGTLFDKDVVVSNSLSGIQEMIDKYSVSKIIFIGFADSLRNDLHLGDIIIVKGVYSNDTYYHFDRHTYKEVLNVCGEQYVFGANIVSDNRDCLSLEDREDLFNKHNSAVAWNSENESIGIFCDTYDFDYVVINGVISTPQIQNNSENIERIYRRILKILKRYFDIV